MSAAGDEAARSAARVSVVGSIGYTAFLGGPPLVGLLADHVGILSALFVVVAALTLGLAASGAVPPPRAEGVARALTYVSLIDASSGCTPSRAVTQPR